MSLFAIAAASAVLPTKAFADVPKALLGLAKTVPTGGRLLANMRTITVYDAHWGQFLTRMDILGFDSRGKQLQLSVDIRHMGPEASERELGPALEVLTDAAKHDGVDLYNLLPFPTWEMA